MQDALNIYFNGEKHAGLFLAGVGVAVIAGAAVIFRTRPDLRPLAVTLGVLALSSKSSNRSRYRY